MNAEFWISLIRAIGLVIVYAMVGFGPGLILGILLANFSSGRDKPLLRYKHEQAQKAAAEHNAQWHPSHKRWQK